MKRGKFLVLVTVVVLLLVMPILGACKQEALPTPPTPTPAPTPAPAPAGPTGTLTVAVPTMGNERWLPIFGSVTEFSMMGEIYEFLIYRKPGSAELIPGVAEKWTMSPDGLTWTFNLRKGIQFHEGNGELTSADVKLTYELMISEKSTHSLTPYFRSSVKSVETPSPYEAIFTMKVPTWDLGYQLSSGVASFGIVSKKYYDAVGMDKATATPIGSGPFKFVENKQGQYLKLEALDKHWRQVPAFKTLIFRAVPELATRIAMLKTGEADITEVTADAKVELEKAGFRIVELANSKNFALHFGGLIFPTRPTYDSKIPWVNADPEKGRKVRQAIALAINKQEIIDYVLGGFGRPLAAQYFFPDMPLVDPAWKPYPYDPEQAKKLLAEAGYPNGFDTTILQIILAGRGEHGPIAEVVSQQLGKVGIRAKIQKVDWSSFTPTNAERKTGGVLYPLGGSRFDEPAMSYSRSGMSTVRLNLGAEDKKLDEMIAKAMTEVNYDKRLAMQRELGKYVNDMYYYVPLASGSSLFAVNKKIGTWPLTPSMPSMFYYEYMTAGAK